MTGKGIARRLEQTLELPEGLLSGDIRMEVYGRRRVVLEGSCGVVEYESDVIRLKTGSGIVRFLGRDLRLSSLDREGAVVNGQIVSIEFT